MEVVPIRSLSALCNLQILCNTSSEDVSCRAVGSTISRALEGLRVKTHKKFINSEKRRPTVQCIRNSIFKNMWNSQEDLSSQFEANPCITGPFLKPSRNGMGSNSSLSKHQAKKNLHQWLRIQEIFHRIKDSETDAEKSGLYLSKFCFVTHFFCNSLILIKNSVFIDHIAI